MRQSQLDDKPRHTNKTTAMRQFKQVQPHYWKSELEEKSSACEMPRRQGSAKPIVLPGVQNLKLLYLPNDEERPEY